MPDVWLPMAKLNVDALGVVNDASLCVGLMEGNTPRSAILTSMLAITNSTLPSNIMENAVSVQVFMFVLFQKLLDYFHYNDNVIRIFLIKACKRNGLYIYKRR